MINGDFSESADWPDLTKPDKDGKYEFIGKKKLYDAYGKWHLGTRKSSPLVDSRSFGRKIKSMIIKACKDGKWDHEDRKQSIYSERRNYAIPPVEECREAFDAFLKGKK